MRAVFVGIPTRGCIGAERHTTAHDAGMIETANVATCNLQLHAVN